MEKAFAVAKSISIRDAGENEYWLQKQIYSDPSCLGLGELVAVEKERRQPSGGRVDMVLKNRSDNTMYEVEVMLGETDPEHIIRTIEYWDQERRRWPKRKHVAVLIAEKINTRFFNVIHLLSHYMPIIAIQVSLVDDEKYLLYFTKILDTYQEVDDGTNAGITKDYWVNRASWMVEMSDYLFELFKERFDQPALNYVTTYIAFTASGRNCILFEDKKTPNALIYVNMKQPHLQDRTIELLGKIGLQPTARQGQIIFTTDKKFIENNKDAFIELSELIKESQGTK